MPYTKRAVEVFAPTTVGGAPRRVDNGDAQTWGTEIEDRIDPFASQVAQNTQDIILINQKIGSLGSIGPAGAAGLAAIGTDEARIAYGIGAGRLLFTPGNHVVNPEQHSDNFYFAVPSSGQAVRFDVRALRVGPMYTFINGGSGTGKIEIDSSAEIYFTGAGIPPFVNNIRLIEVAAGSMCHLRRTGGNQINVEMPAQSYWIVSGINRYRMDTDGTFEIINIRPEGSIISPTSSSTANNVPTTFDITNAITLSVSLDANSGGTTPTLPPPVITGKGTTHSLNPYQFRLYNPGSSNTNTPIVTHFIRASLV